MSSLLLRTVMLAMVLTFAMVPLAEAETRSTADHHPFTCVALACEPYDPCWDEATWIREISQDVVGESVSFGVSVLDWNAHVRCSERDVITSDTDRLDAESFVESRKVCLSAAPSPREVMSQCVVKQARADVAEVVTTYTVGGKILVSITEQPAAQAPQGFSIPLAGTFTDAVSGERASYDFHGASIRLSAYGLTKLGAGCVRGGICGMQIWDIVPTWDTPRLPEA